jgi:hypothetical protein
MGKIRNGYGAVSIYSKLNKVGRKECIVCLLKSVVNCTVTVTQFTTHASCSECLDTFSDASDQGTCYLTKNCMLFMHLVALRIRRSSSFRAFTLRAYTMTFI